VGEVTASARADVLTARAALDSELDRLEAAARAAVDIKAKIRRHPVKTAGAAAGAGFLLLGGPRRVFRGAKRAILGPAAVLPKSMLPKEIDKALRELGSDGNKVRGTLEREFAAYLEAKAPERKNRDLGGVVAGLLASVGRPVTQRYGKQLAEQLLSPDGPGFVAQLEKVRARRAAATKAKPTTGTGEPAT
jgi:hypothetical protein